VLTTAMEAKGKTKRTTIAIFPRGCPERAKAVFEMKRLGIAEGDIQRVVWDNRIQIYQLPLS